MNGRCFSCFALLGSLLLLGGGWIAAQEGLAQLTPRQSVSLPMDTSELMSASGNCGVCHTNLSDQSGADVSIDSDWRSAMMANSARDPFFLAQVADEVEAFPHLKEVIEEKCANCHMGMAHVQADADGEMPSVLGDGFLSEDHPLNGLAMDGVSCTLCHQIEDEQLGEPATFSGEYPIDLETPRPDRKAYGPFENPVAQSMQSFSGFLPLYDEHISGSRLCATCHTLYTPFVDENGEVAGTFPEQTPYLEWLHSRYSQPGEERQDCQDCHLPKAEGGVVTSIIPSNLEAREPFSQHHFVGGNVTMLKMLQRHGQELQVTASSEHYDETIARTQNQLEENTLTLAIENPRYQEGSLGFDLSIEVLTGHKFPTGFPSRRAWLHLIVRDAAGSVVFESGAPNEDGSIAGVASETDSSLYTPHIDLIAESSDVLIYESIMMSLEGSPTFQLLRGSQYVKDNRLLPAGFDKATAGDDFAVQGAARDDENFTGGGDCVSCEIAVAPGSGPWTVEAQMLYQSVSYQFVQGLRGGEHQLITRMNDWFAQSPPEAVAVGNQALRTIDAQTGIHAWPGHQN